jgi:hypothetical protein
MTCADCGENRIYKNHHWCFQCKSTSIFANDSAESYSAEASTKGSKGSEGKAKQVSAGERVPCERCGYGSFETKKVVGYDLCAGCFKEVGDEIVTTFGGKDQVAERLEKARLATAAFNEQNRKALAEALQDSLRDQCLKCTAAATTSDDAQAMRYKEASLELEKAKNMHSLTKELYGAEEPERCMQR